MRTVSHLLLPAFLIATLTAQLFASDIKVRIVDPQSAVVASARVALYRGPKNGPAASGQTPRLHLPGAPIAVRSATAEGVVEFHNLQPGWYRLQVLAPGFAEQTRQLELHQEAAALTVQLQVAAAEETVTVTAAATPATGAETSSEVSIIDLPVLQNLQPASVGEILRFAPGAVMADVGRVGSQSTLFVRGGDPDYNKVIIDGVPVNEPGGFFDFGTVSPAQMDRIELLRGSQSTLYGSDAMTSVTQVFSRTGSTRTPLLSLGSDGGSFNTGHGYGSISGAVGRFDYNLFADQFNTQGQGINDQYSNSTQGGNIGYALTPKIQLRLRARHSNSRVGDQGGWNYSNGVALPAQDYNLPPDSNAFSRQNNFLGSTELSIAAGKRWFHRFSGYEYNHRRLDEQGVPLNPLRVYPSNSPLAGIPIDFPDYDSSGNFIPSKTWANYNRAGFNYQGEYWARNWARTIFGYEFEDENGFFGDFNALPMSHGLRRNHAAYGQELLTWRRFSLQAGARYVHNESFGDRAVPRTALSYLLIRGGDTFSGTRLRGSYSEGIKEPSFEDTFGEKAFGVIGNPNLKPEESRSFEAGVSQSLVRGKYSLDATYFNNLFRNQIVAEFLPAQYAYQFANLNRSLAHGAELTAQAHPTSYLRVSASYVYTSTQILSAPTAVDPWDQAGSPLLRRPKHAGSLLATYSRRKYGLTLGGTFIGRRPDSDFFVLPVPLTHDAGYARIDAGGWYRINGHVTAYATAQNLLNKNYEDALGYPGLRASFRAGMRFSFGGDRIAPASN